MAPEESILEYFKNLGGLDRFRFHSGTPTNSYSIVLYRLSYGSDRQPNAMVQIRPQFHSAKARENAALPNLETGVGQNRLVCEQ